MSRLARLRILAVLIAGIVFGAGAAVLVNLNGVLISMPSPTPAYVYIPVYPTLPPTPDEPLTDQCQTVGGAYQVQFADGFPTSFYPISPTYYELPSPDGRARVYIK